MQEILKMILIGYAALFCLQTILWLRQTFTKNASSADVGWSIGMMLLIGWYIQNLNGYWLREALIFGLVFLWSLRLSSYLILRTIKEKKEDSRYARFRESWGSNANKNFFLVYQLQPLFNLILSVPFVLIIMNPAKSLGFLEFLGIAIWLIGLFGESLADRQLAAFKSNPTNQGKICQEGLWRYSRHPNFFFEWVMWLAYAVIALPSPNGYLGIVGPAFMLFLLMKVTGIPVIEQYALKKKGEAFRKYMQTTSFFVPMPRKARND